VSGPDRAREIIAKHGVDRYPTARVALLKLVEEVGELAGAFIDDKRGCRNEQGRRAPAGSEAWEVWREHLRKEYADVGLTLYHLGNVLGLDLETEMQAVVDGETRRFA
jgi:NTP pyrophosphatase (non-canonical NTP hydrolase)